MSFKIKDGMRIGTVDVFNNSGVLLVNAPTATNIASGAAQQIPIQTGASTTGFIANTAGDSGKFLKSTGASTVPIWDTIPAGTTVAADNTAGTFYPLFTSQTSGGLTTTLVDNTTTPLTYVPSTSTLTATNFVGNASTATKSTNLIGGNGTTLLGAIGYQSGTDTTTLLAPNTTSTKNFLVQTGTGTNGAAPTWGTIANADIPSALTGKTYNGLTLTAATTGFTIAGGTTSKTLTMSNSLTFSGTDASSVAFGAGGTVAYTGGKLSQFAATTSAELAGVISDETGYSAGAVLVFSKSPSIENLTVTGTLIVNGTTTTINSTTISVDDKNIELGSVAVPDDTTANGGGITLKGATDKTIAWSSTSTAWDSSENLNLATGKVYKINNVSILSATNLGTSVVNSSLTKVGALSGGTAGIVKTDASGNLTSVATLGATDGGTGLSTYASGDIIYASAANTLAKLAKGADTQVLQLSGGVPTWATVAGTDTLQGISDDTATATPRYITFVANATGAQGGLSATNLLFTPSTGLLNATALKSATQTLKVSSEDISVKSAVVNDSIATTAVTPVDTWAHATYRSAKYIVQITQGTNYQVSEVMVIHNGTTTTMTEYGVLETNGALATITSAINGANVELKVQLGVAGAATINIEKTVIVL